ncbi:hypothetical protein ACYOEI_08925, partial [Singulisphaera rosea]
LEYFSARTVMQKSSAGSWAKTLPSPMRASFPIPLRLAERPEVFLHQLGGEPDRRELVSTVAGGLDFEPGCRRDGRERRRMNGTGRVDGSIARLECPIPI